MKCKSLKMHLRVNNRHSDIRVHSLALFVLFFWLFFGTASNVWAYGGGISLGGISTSAGISTPGLITAVFENPAAIAQSGRVRAADFYGLLPNAGFDDPGFGLQVLPGPIVRDVGISLGVRHLTQSAGTTSAHYGLGFEISGLHAAFGFSGETPISPYGSSTFNAGVLFNAQGQVRVGVTAISVTGGVDEFGGGIGADVAQGVSLVADAIVDDDFNNAAIAPGIRIGNNSASLSVAYGIAADGGAVRSTQITDKFSGGLSLQFNRGWVFQVMYQRIQKWYLGLVVPF